MTAAPAANAVLDPNAGTPSDVPLIDRIAITTIRGLAMDAVQQANADAVLVAKLKSLPNVSIRLDTQTTEITGAAGKVNGLVLRDRASGQDETVALEGVFVQIGLVPNTEWLKGTLALSRYGEVEVDARGQTSLSGVFAAQTSSIKRPALHWWMEAGALACFWRAGA